METQEQTQSQEQVSYIEERRPLVIARNKLGLKGAQVSRALGIALPSLCNYENQRIYAGPEVQKRICEYYRSRGAFVFEGDAFPDWLREQHQAQRKTGYLEIPANEIIPLDEVEEKSLPQVDAYMDIHERDIEIVIEELLSTLTKREQVVLKKIFWEQKTLGDVAKDEGVTEERIRQIKAKAFRKLRHPRRLESLRGV